MKYFFLLLRFLFGLGLWCLMSLLVRPKIKFYLFGIAARPIEKLAAQIILFAFQTNLLLLKKSESRRNFDRVRRVCSGLYLFQILIVKVLDVHCIESIPLCCNASVKGGEHFIKNKIISYSMDETWEDVLKELLED